MAIQRDTEYPGRWGTATADYPGGVPQNRTTPTSADGSYLEEQLWKDTFGGVIDAAIAQGDITRSGAPDTAQSSDFINGMKAIMATQSLEWSATRNYNHPVIVSGSDEELYLSVQDNGPATTVQDPTTDASDTYWILLADAIGADTSAYPPEFIINAQVTVNSGDADHDIDIEQFSLRNDDNDANVNAPSALTKQLDVTFAEGTNAGGMASGESLPISGTFYVFSVTKDVDGTVDVMADTSSTGANVNAGWTPEKLLAEGDTDGSGNISNIRKFYRDGKLSFRSSPSAIVASGPVTVSHGLGKTPKNLRFYLQNVTPEANWLAGDEIPVPPLSSGFSATSSKGFVVTNFDATEISIRYGSDAGTFGMMNKTTGAGTTLSNGNWNFIIEAEL